MKKRLLKLLRGVDDWFYRFVKTKSVLFVVDGLYGFLCQHPIIVELEKKPNIKIGITMADEAGRVSIYDSNNEALINIFQKYLIEKSSAQYMKWCFVLDTHLNSFYPKRNALRIGMHHGPGFGTIGSKVNLVKNFDIFFGLSMYEKKYLESLEPDLFSGKRLFFPVGFPKSDALVNQPVNREDRLRHFGLPNRQTILIASHWVNVSLLSAFQEKAFTVLAEAFPDCNVIQTAHPWMWKKNKDAETKSKTNRYHSITDKQTSKIYQGLRNVERRFENAFFIPEVVAEELIPMADMLVVDHSSIVTSYSLLDRPIVWFKHPDAKFSMAGIEAVYRDASFVFSDLHKFASVCKKALSKPELHRRGRLRMQEVFYSNSGTSAVYAANLIERLSKR